MGDTSFQSFLSEIASRLRHDLKGGLISLKMGLETLPEEEMLKPLLVEKTVELAELSDKLILLLRMGDVTRQPVTIESLLKQVVGQASAVYPRLTIEVTGAGGAERWPVDSDALSHALLELCQNSELAGADRVTMVWGSTPETAYIEVKDNGEGLKEGASLDEFTELGVSQWGRSGLGLTIVERCSRAHGGRFYLRSDDEGLVARMEFSLEGTL